MKTKEFDGKKITDFDPMSGLLFIKILEPGKTFPEYELGEVMACLSEDKGIYLVKFLGDGPLTPDIEKIVQLDEMKDWEFFENEGKLQMAIKCLTPPRRPKNE